MIAVLIGGFATGMFTTAALLEYHDGVRSYAWVWGAFALACFVPSCAIAVMG